MSDLCPEHGEVLAINGECPWGCGRVIAQRNGSRQVPLVSWELQRATEATVLFHLTEPKELTA